MKTTIFILAAMTAALVYLAIISGSWVLVVFAGSAVSAAAMVLLLYKQEEQLTEEFLSEKQYSAEEIIAFMS